MKQIGQVSRYDDVIMTFNVPYNLCGLIEARVNKRALYLNCRAFNDVFYVVEQNM